MVVRVGQCRFLCTLPDCALRCLESHVPVTNVTTLFRGLGACVSWEYLETKAAERVATATKPKARTDFGLAIEHPRAAFRVHSKHSRLKATLDCRLLGYSGAVIAITTRCDSRHIGGYGLTTGQMFEGGTIADDER